MKSLLIAALLVISLGTAAQYRQGNPIRTTADYLQLSPDARSVGMGECGAASSADVFSMHWNPAKFPFSEDKWGIAASYSDYLWMKEFWKFNGEMEWYIGMNTLHGFWNINERSALASSFTYFNPFGEIMFADEFGNELGVYNPYDINFDVSYSYRFTDNLSAAMAARYIYSRLVSSGQYIQNPGEDKNAQSVACDLAVYYQKPLTLGSGEGEVRWGVDFFSS